MGIDRKKFKASFKKDELTNWNCPTCGKGFLKVKEGTFHHEETRDSVRAKESDDWDPEWIEYLYSCLLECINPDCKDIVSSTGVGSTGYVVYDENDIPYPSYEDRFIPKFFSPHLKIFDYQNSIPEGVKDELENSFSLFFCDPPSAANHIRMALENLLTHMKINKTLTKKGKRRYLSLHERIKLLEDKYDDIQDIFMAVKWLGNAGSHSGKTVSSDDALDAYDLMEKLLVEVFDDESKKIKELANKINVNKGPAQTMFSP